MKPTAGSSRSLRKSSADAEELVELKLGVDRAGSVVSKKSVPSHVLRSTRAELVAQQTDRIAGRQAAESDALELRRAALPLGRRSETERLLGPSFLLYSAIPCFLCQ